MAPLIPNILSNEFNFVIALLVGIAFGFVLEQAGFSSSRKLAGVFYGYDFTVLRVFFTAGVTAMLGLLILNHFKMIDLSIIYINPTYLGAALIGGAVMGLGFILGGFCPGTSITALAIGKIDAIFFVIGIFLGVWGFIEFYPVLSGLHTGNFLGAPLISDKLEMSRGVFAFILSFVAIIAFIATYLIQRRVNKVKDKLSIVYEFKKYGIPIALVIVVALVVMIIPEPKDRLEAKINDKEFVNSFDHANINSEKLAYKLINNDNSFQIIDVRNIKEYKEDCIPGATNIPVDSLLITNWSDLIDSSKKLIIYSNDTKRAQKANVTINLLGFDNHSVLSGGINKFKSEILNSKSADKFRIKAAKLIAELPKYPVKKIIKKRKIKIAGGCE